jgi:hypothetical protein
MTGAGLRESHGHGVKISRESPDDRPGTCCAFHRRGRVRLAAPSPFGAMERDMCWTERTGVVPFALWRFECASDF